MTRTAFIVAPAAALAVCLAGFPAAAAPAVYGFLGNFDVVNDTGKTAHGFEIDLEGLHSSDITDTFGGAGRGFPTTVERYGAPTISDYTSGSTFGVKVVYQSAFSAGAWKVGTPSGIFSTPGESCWTGGGIGYGPGTPCDHFGVGTRANATKTIYSWLTEISPTSAASAPVVATLPSPVWVVTPVVVPPGSPPAPPVVMAQIHAPPPDLNPADPQFGTPIWVKVFTTELPAPVALEDLVAGNPMVKKAVTETEWQLLQTDPGNPLSGQLDNGGAAVGGKAEAVLRRYEYYKYTGALNAADNEALPKISDSAPAPGEVGAFIGAQNGAVNLNGASPVGVPEPAGLLLMAGGLIGLAVARRS